MKLCALFITVAVAKPNGKKSFENIFGEERFLRSRTDGVAQQIFFYLFGNNINPPDPSFSNEFQYGCWGQIGDNDIVGKGEPMDELDQAYRNWHMCRSCAEIDGAGSCGIDETPYEIGFNPATNRIDCGANTTPCQSQLCSCDEALAFSFADLWDTINDEFMGEFDHAANCLPKVTVTSGVGGSCAEHEQTEEVATVCCGEYPSRFPYNNKGGCTSCCGAKTYNVYNKSCCDDTIQSFGTC